MSSGEMNRIVDFARPGGLIAPVLAVVLHCTFAQAQTPNDHLIVPWQRIGPMSVGMSAADLVHSMGPPASRQPGEVVTYKWPDVSATVTEDGLWATQICTFDPADVTVEGVHVGSTDLSVTKLLGKPRYSRSLYCVVGAFIREPLLAGADDQRASQRLRGQSRGVENLCESICRAGGIMAVFGRSR